jgi:protein O-GlcNAc transferase
VQYDKAVDFYRRAIEVQASHSEAHCNLGVILKNRGQLEEAIAAYRAALLVAPDFQIVKTNLAIALTEKATLVKAEGDLEKGKRAA